MAFFKFRKSTARPSTTPGPAPVESVEVLRQRARRRLIGAAVLVALAVVGFPLLFDRQPRPIPVDLPIDIPDRDKVKPLQEPASAPAAVTSSASSAAGGTLPEVTSAMVTPAASTQPPSVVASAASPNASASVPSPSSTLVAKPAPAPVAPAVAASKTVAERKPGVGAKATAESASPIEKAGSATSRRWVLQVGAYADDARVVEVRQRLKHAGLETYTQKVKAKDGMRTRVRVGPFTDRAQAEAAAASIRKLDLTVSLLSLS